MTVVLAWIGLAVSLVGAVSGLLCLRTLMRREGEAQEAAEPQEEDEGDAALREGIFNLMRYAPGENKDEEE